MRRLLGLLMPHLGLAGGALVFLLLGSGLSVLGPLAVGAVLDRGIGRGDARLAALAAVGFFLVEALRHGVDYLQTSVLRRLEQRVVRDVRGRLFLRAQRIALSWHARTAPGDLVTRFTQDATLLGEAAAGAAVGGLRDLAVFAAVGAAVAVIHPPLAGVSLLAALLLGVPAVLFRRRAEAAAGGMREAAAAVAAVLDENLAGHAALRQFGLEEARSEKLAVANRNAVEASVRALRARTGFEGAATLASAAALSLVLWVGARGVAGGALTAGLFLAVAQYVPYLLGAVQGVMDKGVRLLAARAASERVFGVLDQPQVGRLGTEGTADLRVTHLRFGYGDREILRDVSFSLRPGDRVAVVGRTGAGKTTLARLLAGLERPGGGELRLPDDLVYAPQASVIFAGTIRENIELGAAIPEEDLREACRVSGAAAWIDRRPKALAMTIRPGGPELSAGERQMLSLARIIARNPRLIILDEPTASLDPASEAAILPGLMRALEGRMLVLITHRPSALRLADRILRLRDGRLEETNIAFKKME